MNAHPLHPSPAARRTARLLPSLVCVLTLFSCQSSGGPSLSKIAKSVNATLDVDQGVIGVGDVLEVRFPYQPTWNQEVVVARDGSTSFTAVGRMVVAGTTFEQLDHKLTEAYSKVFEKPDLAVVLKTFGERKVYVLGEVDEPDGFLIGSDRHITLLQALALAGGPKKESAYLAHTLLLRWSATNQKQLSWMIDAREEYWTGTEPLFLQPYDVVYIPNTPIDDVGIWVDNYIRRLIPFPYLIPAPSY